MTKRAEKAGAAEASTTERRYRSIAEIRRDFFPQAPASLFETGPRKSLEDVIGRLDGEKTPSA